MTFSHATSATFSRSAILYPAITDYQLLCLLPALTGGLTTWAEIYALVSILQKNEQCALT
jgi:hypothetical protein